MPNPTLAIALTPREMRIIYEALSDPDPGAWANTVTYVEMRTLLLKLGYDIVKPKEADADRS